MDQELQLQTKQLTPELLLWEERLTMPSRHPAVARISHFVRWSARLVSRRLTGIGGVVLGLPLAPLAVSFVFPSYRTPLIVAACVLSVFSMLILALLYVESRARAFSQTLATILNEISQTPGVASALMIEQLALEIRRIDPMDARLDRLISDVDRLSADQKRFAALDERVAELTARIRKLDSHACQTNDHE